MMTMSHHGLSVVGLHESTVGPLHDVAVWIRRTHLGFGVGCPVRVCRHVPTRQIGGWGDRRVVRTVVVLWIEVVGAFVGLLGSGQPPLTFNGIFLIMKAGRKESRRTAITRRQRRSLA
jgi:hypothetical protein